jgi:hypothetical protein
MDPNWTSPSLISCEDFFKKRKPLQAQVLIGSIKCENKMHSILEYEAVMGPSNQKSCMSHARTYFNTLIKKIFSAQDHIVEIRTW